MKYSTHSCAGNVTQAGLLGRIKDTKASRQPLRPDEVLFKQANAPIRYEETDYYFAHERLPAEQQLPTEDLLSAVHAYISKFFARNPCPEMEKAWKCMDETALIAFGILLEETAKEILGETGDLAFTEAADEEEERVLRGGNEEDERAQTTEPEKRQASMSPPPSSDDSSDYTSSSGNAS